MSAGNEPLNCTGGYSGKDLETMGGLNLQAVIP